MDKQIYLAISARLKTKVTDLKWIDYDWGQFNDDRAAVAFPCALIDIAFSDCKTLAAGPEATEQMVSAVVTVKLVFQPQGESHTAAPESSRLIALSPLDTIASVHTALQAWNGDGIFAGLSRRRAGSTPRKDRLKVYNITYETTFINVPD
jgi:hypothetical protein